VPARHLLFLHTSFFFVGKNKKTNSAMEEEGRRFSRANRGSRMAVLLSEAMEAQAGGSFPRWALLSPRPACV
jgi:hypothetical protein